MKLLNWLLDLLYPPRCIFCRRFLPSGGPGICASCRRSLPRTSRYGQQKRKGISLCVAPLYYEGDVKHCVHRFKFYDAAAYAPVCAELMEEPIRACLDGCFDVISWVPLSRKRLRRRGYDQAGLLAEELSRRLMIPALPTLVKVRHTAPQSKTGGAEQRSRNIAGAYRAIDGAAEGKRILLIDDVITTGATLSECAMTLRKAGAKDVCCCTFARAQG